MIITKEIKIKVSKQISSKYIENELTKLNFNILRWAIVSANNEYYTLSISFIK